MCMYRKCCTIVLHQTIQHRPTTGFCLIETIWKDETKIPTENSGEREADAAAKRESPSAAGEPSFIFSVFTKA